MLCLSRRKTIACDTTATRPFFHSGRGLYEWYAGAKKINKDHNLNVVADFQAFARHVISINLVTFHPSAKAWFHDVQYTLMEDSKKKGYLEYRTHISFMDTTAANQTFNNNAFGRFTAMLKDTIDPSGILSTEKQGIWNSTVKLEKLGLGDKWSS
ncbi:hypothetical protein QBC36DRAFT_316095 [Triangularia setosa]|uniref:Uncharacterized protein n=1 Tax=Triangularia setosa TaxID=2587417 RepID=A0AAN6VZT6_9PEZI|nr:hypothetical protein QBC36DRAFT_316095 [Podospora setosa]